MFQIQTVADMIATLSKLPPDAQIATHDALADGVEIYDVEMRNGVVVIVGSNCPIYGRTNPDR